MRSAKEYKEHLKEKWKIKIDINNDSFKNCQIIKWTPSDKEQSSEKTPPKMEKKYNMQELSESNSWSDESYSSSNSGEEGVIMYQQPSVKIGSQDHQKSTFWNKPQKHEESKVDPNQEPKMKPSDRPRKSILFWTVNGNKANNYSPVDQSQLAQSNWPAVAAAVAAKPKTKKAQDDFSAMLSIPQRRIKKVMSTLQSMI